VRTEPETGSTFYARLPKNVTARTADVTSKEASE
jgi:hypothetical protein